MQTRDRIFDDLSKLVTSAAGVAQGMREEAETAVRAQLERWVNEANLVTREEFDVVRELAVRAREDAERLEARVAALEARLRAAADPSTGD